jgi:hypothetical protein
MLNPFKNRVVQRYLTVFKMMLHVQFSRLKIVKCPFGNPRWRAIGIASGSESFPKLKYTEDFCCRSQPNCFCISPLFQMNLNLQMSQQSSMNNMNAFNSATGRNPQQPSNPSSTANSQQGHPGSIGNQNPMGNQQANPMGGQNPMGQGQNPMGQSQNSMGQGQNSMGQGQNPMGQSQNPMGQSQNPMGQNQNPMGQNQNPMGQSQMSQQMNHMSSFAYQQHTGNQFGQHHMQQQTYISQQQQVSTPCSVSSGLNGLPSDFNLDFLDSHVTGGDSSFNDQDILRSLESGASFNLQDIL